MAFDWGQADEDEDALYGSLDWSVAKALWLDHSLVEEMTSMYVQGPGG